MRYFEIPGSRYARPGMTKKKNIRPGMTKKKNTRPGMAIKNDSIY
jgi:hypothetical protein